MSETECTDLLGYIRDFLQETSDQHSVVGKIRYEEYGLNYRHKLWSQGDQARLSQLHQAMSVRGYAGHEGLLFLRNEALDVAGTLAKIQQLTPSSVSSFSQFGILQWRFDIPHPFVSLRQLTSSSGACKRR